MVAWTLIFIGAFALDWVWARYTWAIAESSAVFAGLYAMAIILISGVTTISYVNDARLLIPAMAGAFAGTFVSIKK